MERNLFEWEKSQVCKLFDEIQGLSLVSDIDDTWYWKDGVSPEFSVKSAYGVLRGESDGVLSSLYDFFWIIKALPAA